MLWTGLAIRHQLPRRARTIQPLNVPLFTWTSLFLMRSGSLARQVTTRPVNETLQNTGLLAETSISSRSQIHGTQKTTRRRRHRVPRQYNCHVQEHVKGDRPPVKRLSLRFAVAFSETARHLWKTNLEYRRHIRDPFGPVRILAQTNSPLLVWKAYQRAISLSIFLPLPLLDRVSAVLLRSYAPTRQTFLRLHEVLNHIRQQGGHIKRWQWNALIYHSALALRKVNSRDYHSALDVYREMLSSESIPGKREKVQPDIFTYTILLYIAIRTGDHDNVKHAYDLLRAANVRQDRVSRLAIIPYYISTRNFKAINGIAREFTIRGEDIGIDGINAYIWAYGRHNHLDVMEQAYEALRSNLRRRNEPEVETSTKLQFSDIENTIQDAKHEDDISSRWSLRSKNAAVDETLAILGWPSGLVDAQRHDPTDPIPPTASPSCRPHRCINKCLTIWNHHVPNNVTYSIVIQVYAWRMKWRQALQVFRDMLTTTNMEHPWKASPAPYKALHKFYRALFLGFSRHARRFVADTGRVLSPEEEEERSWVAGALEIAFMGFLDMPRDQGRPNDRTVLWIMYAFSNTSNHDTSKLVKVWESLEKRFGPLHVPHSFRHIAKVARQAEE